MDLGILVPITAIAIGPTAWAVSVWARTKHGYPIRERNGEITTRGDMESDRKIELLTAENARLTGQVSRLEDRIAVLERIATDPAERTARAIEALR